VSFLICWCRLYTQIHKQYSEYKKILVQKCQTRNWGYGKRKFIFREMSTTNDKTQSSTWCKTWLNEVILGIRIRLHVLSEMVNNNLNLSICRVKLNCQIRKFKITKLKQQVMPTYCHTDSTAVIENDYMWFLMTNKRYPKNVRQQVNCNSCKWLISL
jgi:hypothetical protein